MTVDQFRARFTWDVSDNGCWVNLRGYGVRQSNGYPVITLHRFEGAPRMRHKETSRNTIRAPRLAYQTFRTFLGKSVPIHTCGNIHCFNPSHLEPGTWNDCKKARIAKCYSCEALLPVEEMTRYKGGHYRCKNHERKPKNHPLDYVFCDRCGKWKPDRVFTRSPLFIGWCKACRISALRDWIASHPGEFNAWKEKRRDEARKRNYQYWRSRYDSDPAFRILECCRRRLRKLVLQNGATTPARMLELLGCDRHHLVEHIERQFLPGMSWKNHGRWHIDHVRPCSSFDLTDPVQLRECFHWTNLQPMWAKQNIRKSDRWDGQLRIAI